MLHRDVKQEIRDCYATFAEIVSTQETRTFFDSVDHAFCHKHYGQSDVSSVPSIALRLACGCGNPVSLADIPPGCTVVDLGCGGGIDVILAAHRAEQGKVLGIDLTPEMIKAAKQAVAESGLQQHIFFRVADIEDIYPLPKTFADVVLANCVINLCPDKRTVYNNIFRILRPGGVLVVSDCVLAEDIDPHVRRHLQVDGTSCLGGAVSEEEHLQNLQKLSFDILDVHRFPLTSEDLETIVRYPERASILPLSREDLQSLPGKATGLTIMAQRRPLN